MKRRQRSSGRNIRSRRPTECSKTTDSWQSPSQYEINADDVRLGDRTPPTFHPVQVPDVPIRESDHGVLLEIHLRAHDAPLNDDGLSEHGDVHHAGESANPHGFLLSMCSVFIIPPRFFDLWITLLPYVHIWIYSYQRREQLVTITTSMDYYWTVADSEGKFHPQAYIARERSSDTRAKDGAEKVASQFFSKQDGELRPARVRIVAVEDTNE